MSAVEFFLPTLPPSKNDLRKRSWNGIVRTKEYEAWRKAAGLEIMIQRVRPVPGRYKLKILAQRPKNKNRDLGNILEATEDLLQWMRVIENDRLSEEILLRWVDDVDSGCVIHVEQA